ncbi:MAG: penicillin acylase family protein [Chitinophagales bacterium]
MQLTMMLRNPILLLMLSVTLVTCAAQAQQPQVTIVRDSFGVPHIYGKTDADAAYGLAWAHCEDDFKSIQENLLAGQGRLGLVKGKEGALFDFALTFFGIDTFVDNHYDSRLSDSFKLIISSYVAAVNRYAQTHPDEVLVPNALPFTEKQLVRSGSITLTLFAGAGMALKAVRQHQFEILNEPNEVGSNSMAIAPWRTEDGKSWLLVNSHQPIEGRLAWYEAHIKSDQGWDVIGGLFPGGVSIFVGSNPFLGWAHTTNYHNFGDVYQITHRNGKYLYDGKWIPFATKYAHLVVKLGGLKIAIRKKIPVTGLGPVFKTKHGWYAFRFPGATAINAMEQWFAMNKAQNFEAFEKALRMEAIPLFNVMYADYKNIYYQSGGMIPWRDSTLGWTMPVPGNTSQYRWQKLVPYASKPQLFNPRCGYLYSCNQTPYAVSGDSCGWTGSFPGIQRFNYNRGERFGQMLQAIPGKITWQQFLAVKFDKQYAANGSYMRNFKVFFQLDAHQHEPLADAIALVKQWNLSGDTGNRHAALMLLAHQYLIKKQQVPFAFLSIKKAPIQEDEALAALRYARRFMLKHYGTLEMPLGAVQRHVRGEVSLPASGLREVSRAADPKLVDKSHGIWKIVNGDGYIQMNRYGPQGAEVLSVNAYGASAHADSRHYTDQMRMFCSEQFKTMTFNWLQIRAAAEAVYAPGGAVLYK